MSEKRRLGFKTPVTEVQDELDEMRRLLDGAKADWASVRDMASSMLHKEGQEMQKGIRSGVLSEHSVMEYSASIKHLLLVEFIARLGISITETHERLTKVEKTVKELKRRIK